MRERAPDEFYARFEALVVQAAEEGTTLPMIAAAIGIHFSQLYRWRQGETGPSASNLAALADYFGVTMDWIWGRPGASRVRSAGEDVAGHPLDELEPGRQDDQSEPNTAAG